MSEFDQSLARVHEVLTQLQDKASGPISRASLESLHRLVAAAKTGGALPAQSAPTLPQGLLPPVAREQSATEPNPAPAQIASTTTGGLGLAARARAAMAASASSATAPEPPRSVAPVTVSKPEELPKRPEPPTAPSSAQGTKAERMDRVRERALVCTRCAHLAASRTQVVFGVGNIDTELMFVGEAPGADEDLQGEPFVGKAGQLLTKIIEAMGFQRSEIYIGNVLKCRPDMPPGESGNRKPRPEEMATCLPYLVEQIEIIQPKCLVALGATAMEGLLGKEVTMRDVRGRWHSFKGIPLMATYHPAYLLRNQSLGEKRKVWEDMLQVLELLAKPITAKQRGFFLPKPEN